MRMDFRGKEGQEVEFIAVVARVGRRKNRQRQYRPTLLIRRVEDLEGNLICDHLWLDIVPPISQLHPMYGDIIKIRGKIRSYLRGSTGTRQYYYSGQMTLDFTLGYIDNVEVVGHIREDEEEELLGEYVEQED